MRISDILSSLTAVYNEWNFFLVNPRYIRNGRTISWQGYQPKILEDLLFTGDVTDMYNEGQYSFQILEDGSLIQIYYLYDQNDHLISANLAYFHMDIEENRPIGWLRIDYDPSSFRGILHSSCHMHISLFPDTRFIVKGVPSPKQFVEFIVAMCYPELYERCHTDKNGNFTNENRICSINDPCFPLPDEKIYQFMAYFQIPVSSTPPILTQDDRVTKRKH